MTGRSPIPLSPALVDIASAEFEMLSAWPFADAFVSRLLREDIPQRVQFGHCKIWLYRDPSNTPVGFGTIDITDHYASFLGGKTHSYIPLLAVNPTIKSLGYGTTILEHLIGEAALLAKQGIHDVLLLDVYLSSVKAISLYEKCGFERLTKTAIFDEIEKADYIVMGKRVSISR